MRCLFIALTLLFSYTMNAQDIAKSAVVKYFKLDKSPSYQNLEEVFSNNKVTSYNIDCINWPERNNGYNPICSFKAIYTPTHLFIRYEVKERALRANFNCDQGSKPWTEDCVELFIIPNPQDSIYFNFEFSCIGYGIAGKGAERKNREYISQEEMDKIIRHSTLGRKPFGDRVISDDCPDRFYSWSMIIGIPLEILCGKANHKLLKGKSVRANVYKCGDMMVKPHYLSWSPVGTPTPNFHTPEYFGVFKFE